MSVEVEALRRSVDDQASSINVLRDEMRESTKAAKERTSAIEVQTRTNQKSSFRLTVALILLALVILAVLPAAVVVTLDNRQAIEENNRKLCPVLTIGIPGPADPQPATELGKVSVERRVGLAREFGCPLP